jgi:hypothetical protein
LLSRYHLQQNETPYYITDLVGLNVGFKEISPYGGLRVAAEVHLKNIEGLLLADSTSSIAGTQCPLTLASSDILLGQFNPY